MMILAGFGVWYPFVYLGAFIGAMLIDADTPLSGIGKIIPLWALAKDRYKCHRKITHSFFFTIFISSFAYVWIPAFGMGVLLGSLIHILEDSCTRVGLPYGLWPYRYNKEHWYFTGKLPWLKHDDNTGEINDVGAFI